MTQEQSKDQCWVCCEKINNTESILLPYEDEYLGGDVSIFKNTFIIKDVGPFKFLYYLCCNKCMDNYLKYYGRSFNYVRKREIGQTHSKPLKRRLPYLT